MKKLGKIFVICSLFVAFLGLTSCFGSEYTGSSSTNSGDRIDLGSSTVKCDTSYDTDIENSYYSITLKSSCSGYSNLSYFDCWVFVEFTYEGLNDAGEYVKDSIIKSYKLDNDGDGEIEKNETLTSYRSIRSACTSVTYKGYVVVK